MAEPHGQLMRYKKRRRRPSLFLRLRARDGEFRRPGGEQVLRLRARDGEFRAPARVTFFCCQKKVTKENHLDLRFKDPLARGGFRRCGGEQVLRLRARDGEFRAPARVTFFFCKKKVTKENHSNLRFKYPLARGGQVQIWRCVLAGGVQRSSLSVKRTVPAFTGAEASATACLSHGRGICFYRVAIIKSRPLRREAPQWVGVPVRHGV